MAIPVHVHGALGRMGQETVRAVAADPGFELCGTSDREDDLVLKLQESRPEVLVEFTVAAAAAEHVRMGLEAGAHVVSGTTGLPAPVVQQLGILAAQRGRGLLLAPNFCIGVLLAQRFCREAAAWLADVEIIEMHHEHKRDAPSGTALATADQIAAAAEQPLNDHRPEEVESLAGARGARAHGIPIHSVRLPGLLAHQEVIFGARGQVLTIRHDTLDRQAFMPGVLLGIRRIRKRKGLVNSLEDLLEQP